MHVAIPLLLQYAFMAWCSVKKNSTGATLPYLSRNEMRGWITAHLRRLCNGSPTDRLTITRCFNIRELSTNVLLPINLSLHFNKFYFKILIHLLDNWSSLRPWTATSAEMRRLLTYVKCTAHPTRGQFHLLSECHHQPPSISCLVLAPLTASCTVNPT
jgi:hypothetical protein